MIKKNTVIIIAIGAVIAGYFIGRMHYKMYMKNNQVLPSAPGEEPEVVTTEDTATSTEVTTAA